MTVSSSTLAPAPARDGEDPARMRRRPFPRPGNSSIAIGATILGTITLIALAAPWLGLADPYDSNLAIRHVPPVWDSVGSWQHPLGTDHLGRDYLSRLVYGARISLLVGMVVTVMAGCIGTTLGVLAGYFGGRIEAAIDFVITVRLAMPLVLIALAVVNVVGSSLEIVILVLGLLLWERFAVVARSTTQQIRSQEYVAAARAVGCSTPRIILLEILPNIYGPLIVVATLEIAHAILLEAALSFLGLGVPAPLPSWGLMIAEGKDVMYFSPWVITIPGAALFVLILSINLLGDGLRDLNAIEGRN